MKSYTMNADAKLILFNLNNKKSAEKPPQRLLDKESHSSFYISEPNAEYESL